MQYGDRTKHNNVQTWRNTASTPTQEDVVMFVEVKRLAIFALVWAKYQDPNDIQSRTRASVATSAAKQLRAPYTGQDYSWTDSRSAQGEAGIGHHGPWSSLTPHWCKYVLFFALFYTDKGFYAQFLTLNGWWQSSTRLLVWMLILTF